MKKVIFTTIFTIVFSLVSMANSTVEKSVFVENKIQNNFDIDKTLELKGSCTVIIKAYNSDGECVGSAIHTFPADSQGQCDQIADQVLMLYEIGILTI